MPAFDGTGPRGMGPMTGWGRGYCAMPGQPPFINPNAQINPNMPMPLVPPYGNPIAFGYGRPRWGMRFGGRGFGRGRGWRW